MASTENASWLGRIINENLGVPMKINTDAVQNGEKFHIDRTHAIISKIGAKGAKYVLADGRQVKIEDRNIDTDGKRRRLALARYEKAVQRWGLEATVYEYRLTFPAHLDVLDHQDADAMWAMINVLAPDAFLKMEDVRGTSTFPTTPHGHFVSTVLLPDDMPGLWRHPEPLDMHTINLSDKDIRTLYGFFWYIAKPTLGGAVRPGKKQYRTLRQQFSKEDLARHLLAAQDRTAAAQARSKTNGHCKLPDTAGWITGGKKRKKLAA